MTRRPDPFALLGWCLWLYAVLVVAFLLLPLAVIVPAAFNDSSLLQFPPQRWSLRWFHVYITSRDWLNATWTSLKIAVTVSILATILGLLTSVVLVRFNFLGKRSLRILTMGPLFIPIIITAVALYYFFLQIGIKGSVWALIIGHTIVAFPYTTVVITASLGEIDKRLEDAAVGLGAPRPRAFVEVTLPLLSASLAVSVLFGFLISFDEVVVSVFVSGLETMTLPRRMWDGIRYDLDPTIAAVSTFLLVLSITVLALTETLRRALKRRSGQIPLVPAANAGGQPRRIPRQ
jgi:ABC-type spermidine/putrescine transport system permease subunit II